MESRALGGELDEHRDRAVRLRARGREQAVGDLALHHHAPALDVRQPVEALDEERRRDVVRQVCDELRRVACKRAGRAAARRRSGARRSRRSPRRYGSSDAVELDRVRHARRARRGSASARRAPGPISSTTSSGPSSASRPITSRMFWSTRKCWPSDFLGGDSQRRSIAPRSRRSAARARRDPRRAPARALRACA